MNKIDQLKQFLKATPNDSFLQHALALELIKLGNDEDAKLLFENVLLNEPAYVGSYYHLGKLLERIDNFPAALKMYELGMQQAKLAKDNHSFNELQGALEDLEE